MSYVITGSCLDIKDKSCVEVCPVDAIYEADRMMYIHPDECVDCARCESVCPTMSIYHADDLPQPLQKYLAINAEVFSGLGAPGGARKVGRIADHPDVAVHARQDAAETPPSSSPPAVAATTSAGPIAVRKPAAPRSSDPDQSTPLDVDVAIIGAGPVGLYGAYYAGFRGLRVALIDSLPQPGGQCAALYPEKDLFDIAGFPAVKGQDLIDRLIEQAASASPHYLLGHQVEELSEDAQAGRVRLVTSQGRRIDAKAALIAGGLGHFTPKTLDAEAGFTGQGIHYFVPRLQALADQDVVIVGGGDSAVDWALALEPIARSVALVHRRDSFRAHEASVQRLRTTRVNVLTPCEVSRIHGSQQVESVEIRSATGTTQTLPAQALVVAIGFLADLGPMERWGLQIQRRHIQVDRQMKTNLPRVFAAGDITDYEGKIRILAVGFAEAAIAINHIAPLVDSRLSTEPGHSSDHAPAISSTQP